MIKNQQKQLKQNKYTFEFIDGSQFIINGEPDKLYEFRGVIYKGYYLISKNETHVNGIIRKVTINEICNS